MAGIGGQADRPTLSTFGREFLRLVRVSNTAREPRTPVTIPAALSVRLEMAYAACLASLRDRCEALAA